MEYSCEHDEEGDQTINYSSKEFNTVVGMIKEQLESSYINTRSITTTHLRFTCTQGDFK
jgi:hypothetical protein